ncbi:MAG TPA: discoidin domain-containing protein [Thermoanaerobaculia bacterium]|nr:discoidin domain-containing protein [Thermoanaerobaculia bacterium]
MRVAAATLAALLLLARCGETAAPPETDSERNNLLNAGYGAAVIARTGELTLQDSAMRAIDGDPESAWKSPPYDPKQTLVFSLPAPVRIERLGLQTTSRAGELTRALTFEVSEDGETFEQVLDVKVKPANDPQLFDAPVPRARYVRVNVLEGGSPFASLRSIRVHGQWLAPPTVAPLTGCWTINGNPARFIEREGRIEGIIEEDEPLLFSGGVHGATYLLTWAKGPQWGEGLVTLSPDGERLSGLRWHEEPAAHSNGNGWFGARTACSPDGVAADRVWERFLAAEGWYPLFSLYFDETDSLVDGQSAGGLDIIANVARRLPSQRIRLVGREHRESTAEENRKRAAARLQSLRTAMEKRGIDVARIDFHPVGSESPRRPTPSAALRLLYSVVEMQIAEPAQSAF